VLFDLDGVITPTADIHEHAWAALFARWDFASSDYLTYVDGKPRYDGVRSFLHSRGVDLPWGDPTDPPGDGTVCAMGNRKNDLFNEVLDRDGVEPYPGTLAVLDLLDAHGVPQAIVSSSKNARAVLAAAGMTDRFPAVVDGVAAGVAGGFALVLGVDRGGNRAALVEAGAHLVVTDLVETLDGTRALKPAAIPTEEVESDPS
jgi:beta-phosphoglucomutase-like phosphatase (HAD superfamily)